MSEISWGFFGGGGGGAMLGMNENIYWGINEVLISYLENELFDKVIVWHLTIRSVVKSGDHSIKLLLRKVGTELPQNSSKL